MTANANVLWQSSDGDMSDWSLLTYKNKTSGTIGNFQNSSEGMEIDSNGLSGNELGYLKYTLGSGQTLAGYDKGSISITYQDLPNQMDAGLSDVLPQVLFLQGTNSSGDTLILAGTLSLNPSGTSATIDFTSANFNIVSTFHYSGDQGLPDPWGGPTEPISLNYSASGVLSDIEFSAFLDTVDGIIIRSYNSYSSLLYPATVGGEIAEIPYTYITELSLSSAIIPEPATATLGILGLSSLLLRRRRKA